MKTHTNTRLIMLLGFIFFSFFSCNNELTIEMPQGPAGPQGLSAYELWVQAVKDGTIDWDINNIDLENFFLYLKGKDGQNGTNGKSAYELWVEEVAKGIDDPHNLGQQWSKNKTSLQDFWFYLTGAKGQDGSTPIIGSNGNWFISGKDTGIPAKGQDGSNGKDGSVVSIGSNGNWFIDGSDTGIKAFGKDGSIVSIGSNGNWFIDGTDTGIPVKGQDGQNGVDGNTPIIGSNGNWYISGNDTGVPARGQNGVDGNSPTIGSNGNWFIGGADTGVPARGNDGTNGSNGNTPIIGSNGNWFIDGTDTGVPAKGDDGKDGQSAYDLWVQEVAKGLDDPHNPGQQWPKDKTSTQNFWEFLSGKDGEDGEGGQPGGETGQPGADIKLVPGKPNVIPQYVNQTYNEFVRWEDGGVGYIVYDDAGNIASDARVWGLPGVKDPNKVYAADVMGFFSVPKEDLPENVDISLRRGVTSSVRYIKSTTGQIAIEPSAPNTYVPNRIFVRISLKADPVIDGTYMKFSPIVERQTDGSDWKVIPSYLGDLKQALKAYELGNPNDLTSYDEYSVVYTATDPSIDISSNISSVKINRLKKKTDYYPIPSDEWDGLEHHFTLVLESYYGENPQVNAIIKMAPIQAMPMIKNAKAFDYEPTIKYFKRIEGELDITGANIDYSLLFKNTLKKETKTSGGITYTYYLPETDDPTVYNNAKQFTVRFRVSGNTATDSNPSILNPGFSFTTPYIESSVILECTSSYFYPLNTIGYLRFGTVDDLNTLTIVKRNDSHYVFPNIHVPYATE
ncbi:MAG: hypothetical protein ACK5KT_12480 [Dysgonomonas sp.]